MFISGLWLGRRVFVLGFKSIRFKGAVVIHRWWDTEFQIQGMAWTAWATPLFFPRSLSQQGEASSRRCCRIFPATSHSLEQWGYIERNLAMWAKAVVMVTNLHKDGTRKLGGFCWIRGATAAAGRRGLLIFGMGNSGGGRGATQLGRTIR